MYISNATIYTAAKKNQQQVLWLLSGLKIEHEVGTVVVIVVVVVVFVVVVNVIFRVNQNDFNRANERKNTYE